MRVLARSRSKYSSNRFTHRVDHLPLERVGEELLLGGGDLLDERLDALALLLGGLRLGDGQRDLRLALVVVVRQRH